MEKGVSVVICCYNSSKLLPETLRHICIQSVPPDIKWEVIIVDNSSTDNTSETAREFLLKYNCPVSYKIIHESIPGLSFARKAGIENAQFEYLIFCDDDNRLNSDYIETAFNIMEKNNNIGICGGKSDAMSDTEFPDWFNKFSQSYSVGKQAVKTGYILEKSDIIWGAGMVVRNTVVRELYSKGFKSLLTDRKQGELTSGGDSELCYAMKIFGVKIYYDENLKLKHYLPDFRLNWKYLKRLHRAFGAQKIYFEPYLQILNLKNNSGEITGNNWQAESYRLIKKLRSYGFKKLLKLKDIPEGNEDALRIEKTFGRLKELLSIRKRYDFNFRQIKNADWVKKKFSE